MKNETVLALFCSALFVAEGVAAPSKQYIQWAKGPVQYLMSPQEQKEWKSVATDDQAKSYAEAFWARRDPTPGTAENEYRTAHEMRVQHADKNFGWRKTAGSMTDRGKVWVILGEPRSVEKGRRLVPSRQSDSKPGELFGVELWKYEAARAQGLPATAGTVVLSFVEEHSGDYRLIVDLSRTLRLIAASAIQHTDRSQ